MSEEFICTRNVVLSSYVYSGPLSRIKVVSKSVMFNGVVVSIQRILFEILFICLSVMPFVRRGCLSV